jgi:cell division septal protein FtsQ
VRKRFRSPDRRRRQLGRGQPPRFAREAARRRNRARGHLERVRARRARRAPSRRTPARIAVVCALLSAAALAATLLTPELYERARSLLRAEALALETIAVEGALRLAPADVARVSGVVAGVALFDVDVADVEGRVLAHPWIARVRALRLPPSTLLVRVSERVPRATIAIGGQTQPFLVDAEGVPFAAATPTDLKALPRIVIHRDLAPGEPNAELATAVALLGAIADLGVVGAEEIAIAPETDPAGFSFRQRGSTARAVLGRDAFDAKLSRFAQLLAAGRPETTAASRIDLRFRDQVVLEGVPPRIGAEQEASARGGARASTAERSG